jgi:hypothetical protein
MQGLDAGTACSGARGRVGKRQTFFASFFKKKFFLPWINL